MKSDNIVFKSLSEMEQEHIQSVSCPVGYLEINLSTQGKMGAPKSFHIRNFKVREILSLSLTSEQDLPSRLIEILNDMIYEDVDVGNWHEKEIEETMVYVFLNFYKDTLTDIAFPLDKSDLEYLATKPNGESLLKDIADKKWTPRTSITISKDASTYDLPEDFSTEITVKNKNTGFFVTFDYIKYKDQIVIKKWLDNLYREESFKYKVIEEQLRYNEEISFSIKDNPENASKLIKVNPELEEEYKNYLKDRMETAMEVIRLISIVNYNGVDISQLSLSKKYELMANDARIDYGLISKLDKRQKKMKFGLKPEVTMLNPITNEMCTRGFSFRIPSIIQAMQVSGDDNYDDGYDDED